MSEEKRNSPYGDKSFLGVCLCLGVITFFTFAVYGAVGTVIDRCVYLAEQQEVIIKNQRQLQKDLEQINRNVLRIR